MASSTSSYCGGSNRLERIARQWYGHAAGLFLLWTRLGAPWAVVAGWLAGRGNLLTQLRAMGVLLALAPLAVSAYAAAYMLVRQLPPVPLERLKALDTLLLGLAVAAGAATAWGLMPVPGPMWLLLPASGVLISAWVMNWCHEGLPAAPGEGMLPPPPFLLPPVIGPISAGYRSYDRSHTGVDIAVAEGTPIRAPAPGVVLHAGPLEQWGYAVLIDLGDGWSCLMAHLEGVAVPRGTAVEGGDLVGWSGTSGISTGPHVHLELRYADRPVDPAPMLNGTGT